MRGERIGYAVSFAPAGLGWALVAATERGLCALLLGDDAGELKAELGARFPLANIEEDARIHELYTPKVFSGLRQSVGQEDLPLDLRGTAFQTRVWAALRAIPRGQTRTYAQVAAVTGNPKTVRAVARACAANPTALVVPCHRVIGSGRSLTGYRWGVERKQALLELETTPGA